MKWTSLMWGRQVRRGVTLERAKITDPAPQIIYLLDLFTPSGMDGQVRTEALAPVLAETIPSSSKTGCKGGRASWVTCLRRNGKYGRPREDWATPSEQTINVLLSVGRE